MPCCLLTCDVLQQSEWVATASAEGLHHRFCRGPLRSAGWRFSLSFPSKPLLREWSKPPSDTVSSFHLSVRVSFLHVLIPRRPLTSAVSNGIACRGHGTRSRSCKCTPRVCTSGPIDASLALMSGRIEPSTVLSVRALSQFLKSPWNWAETHAWKAELLYRMAKKKKGVFQPASTNRSSRASAFNKYTSPFSASGYHLKFYLHLPNIVQTGVSLCKDESWCIFNDSFCKKKKKTQWTPLTKYFSGMKGSRNLGAVIHIWIITGEKKKASFKVRLMHLWSVAKYKSGLSPTPTPPPLFLIFIW